jgi:hypothetical protein
MYSLDETGQLKIDDEKETKTTRGKRYVRAVHAGIIAT